VLSHCALLLILYVFFLQAVPVVVQTPTDPEVSQIIEEIRDDEMAQRLLSRSRSTVGKAVYKLGDMTKKSFRVAKSSVGTDRSYHDPSSHHSVASSARYRVSDEELGGLATGPAFQSVPRADPSQTPPLSLFIRC
jgi:hypothetical protein